MQYPLPWVPELLLCHLILLPVLGVRADAVPYDCVLPMGVRAAAVLYDYALSIGVRADAILFDHMCVPYGCQNC